MKKVEIVTLHRVTNFGSLLQTLALQYYLEKNGCEVEILDFVPIGLSFRRAIWPHNGNNILKKIIKFLPNFIMNCVQYNMMNKFIERHICVSSMKYYRYSDIVQNCPNADIFLTGSDQVWNTQNDNRNDDIKAYYLCFAPRGCKRVAYAGSFGRDDFTEKEMNLMCKWLNEYSCISVREDTGLTVLSKMGIDNGQHVLDPTLLLTKKEWRRILPIRKIHDEYVFVYNLNRSKLVEKIAIAISKEKHMKIINAADSFELIIGAKNKFNNNPVDFLTYIANASYIVTDSFHGTAFAINFHKEFITVPAPRFNSRIESILRIVQLDEKRYCNSLNSALSAIKEKVDWIKVDEILNEKRNTSANFLQEAINE